MLFSYSFARFTETEHEEQLRLARSTCISVAVLALGWAGEYIATAGGSLFIFALNTFMCCLQVGLLLLYSCALNRRHLVGADQYYVQPTLLTSAFLGDTSYNLLHDTNLKDVAQLHHEWTAYALGLLWGGCIIFWIWKLAELGIVRRPGGAETPRVNSPPVAIAIKGRFISWLVTRPVMVQSQNGTVQPEIPLRSLPGIFTPSRSRTTV